jgi:hypothetical protein
MARTAIIAARLIRTAFFAATTIVFATPAIFVAAPAAAQVGYKADPQGKDELWDVTSKMEMPGMPMAMPAQTHRVCSAKGSDEGMVPAREGCRITDLKRSGNTVSYRMACRSGNDDYTATGESTGSANAYQGRMQMSGKMQGESMEMAMTYSGARAGNCTRSK